MMSCWVVMERSHNWNSRPIAQRLRQMVLRELWALLLWRKRASYYISLENVVCRRLRRLALQISGTEILDRFV